MTKEFPVISSFIYCEKVEEDPETGKPVISSPLPKIILLSIPSAYSFSVIFSILGIDEPSNNHFLRIRFMDPKENILVDTESFNLKNGIDQEDLPFGMLFAMDFRNINLKAKGIHWTEIILDDDIIGKYPIPVEEGGEENETDDK